MKKNITLALVLILCTAASALAQGVVTSELELYASNHYSTDWSVAATSIFSHNPLVNGDVQYSEVIEAPGRTREDLYKTVRQWMISTFGSLKDDSQKDGRLVASDVVYNVSELTVGIRNAYRLNITPEVRIDIKEGKIRLTVTNRYYKVDKTGGITGKTVKKLFGSNKLRSDELWYIKDYYPFTSTKEMHCSEAYVKTFCYGPVLAQKIKTQVLTATSSLSDDW